VAITDGKSSFASRLFRSTSSSTNEVLAIKSTLGCSSPIQPKLAERASGSHSAGLVLSYVSGVLHGNAMFNYY